MHYDIGGYLNIRCFPGSMEPEDSELILSHFASHTICTHYCFALVIYIYVYIYIYSQSLLNWCIPNHNKTQQRVGDVAMCLILWGRVTHICVSKLTIIGSDNGLSPGRRQAIIWTNTEILLIGPLGTKFSEILTEIHTFSFKKMHLKMSSGKWRPFCLGLNVFKMFYKGCI